MFDCTKTVKPAWVLQSRDGFAHSTPATTRGSLPKQEGSLYLSAYARALAMDVLASLVARRNDGELDPGVVLATGVDDVRALGLLVPGQRLEPT